MIFFKIIIFTLAILVISYLLGKYLLLSISDKVELTNRITMKLFAGFVTLWLISFVVFSVSSFAGLSVVLTLNIWLVCLVLKGLSLFMMSRNKPNNKTATYKLSKTDKIFHLCLMAMVLIQIMIVMHYQYNQIEASRNIWIATKSYESGSLVKAFGMMNFWGALSTLFRVHPLTFIYMVIPAGMLLFYYIGYYEVIMEMSHNNRKVSTVGVFIVCLLQIWGFQSQRLIPLTLLFSWFSLGCLVLHSLLPFAFVLINGYIRIHPRVTVNAIESDKLENDEDYQEEWDMKKHKIINARNLAIALGLLAVMLVAFVFILNNKINTLHDSTVNMQEDLNKRCAVYDFNSQGASYGYLLKGTDGSLTMIGGGSAKTGDELYNFIEKYGDSLSNWYLYGIDEEDAGGYIYCVNEKGLKVENVYILDRTKLEELMK